ncbi:MAG: anthranilate synthase component I family protein, partial [Clostridium sp.]|nr:anthranilate synthase component I family protein [Clostridium sp.]
TDLQKCEDFCKSVIQAKEYIKSGDIYQIQLCRHEFSNIEIAPVELYERLVKINPAPYMYYMDLDDVHIISSSPELMIRYDNGLAQARPIAGTMSKLDKRNERLDCIPKEEAEHLMLVDLARNDIARCAVKGGVNVPSFMALEDYGKLYHLVSTVESQIQDKYDIWDIIPANFPAGTMTGAPKVRAMQLIADFEQAPRGLFTGCVGMITGNKKGVLALTIRTIIGDRGNYSLNACAGIVADSQPMAEWEEAGAKIQSFARILNNK